MTCASCSARVERALDGLPGVERVSVNLATGEARVGGGGHLPLLGILEAIRNAGYDADPVLGEETLADQPSPGEDLAVLLRDLKLAALLTVPLMVLAMFGPQGPVWGSLQGLMAAGVLAFPGRRFFVKAWRLLRHGGAAMETLIALGAGVAWLGSLFSLAVGGHLYFESAAMIVTLILLGRVLEGGAKDRAAAAIRELSRLLPDTALRIDDEGREEEVSISSLQPGDLVRVRSGARVPTDGFVVKGEGSVDESVLTGESRLIRRASGDALTGASLLRDGFVEMRVSAVGDRTVLAGIVRLVRETQASKAPVQRLADRVASVFVPIVLGIAALTVLLHLVFAPEIGATALILRAAAVLVIACPCALGLATPTAILVGSGAAARRGILFRDAASLERLQSIRVLAIDKTGTLTRGTPQVARFVSLGALPRERIFRYIAAAEDSVEHPLAAALREYCKERAEGKAFALSVITRPGGGIRAEVQGAQVIIGAAWYLESEGVDVTGAASALEEMESAGLSPVLVSVEGELAAVVGLEDELRPEAPALVHRLKELGIRPVLLSGDRPEAVMRTALQAGIEDYAAALRPEDKARRIRAIQGQEGMTAMLGDGVNDAPALAAADVGIALASGTDVAVASAPVTLVHGGLARVLEAVEISRRTLRTIRQNLFWAFFYNLLALPLAALGVLNPMIAAAAMAASSLFVVTNSLRLRGAGAVRSG